jgi:TolB-like protein/Tfp pilus assembly protein PilF
VVEKQELFEQVWKENFVSDNALTRVIREIRQAIGDDASAPRYIETIPKRGYRFIAEISTLSGNRSSNSVTSQPIKARPEALPTMAVLPFKLFSSGSDDDYLGLGLADALITRLSNARQVVVRPTSSVLKYAQVVQDPVSVGRELHVESVLEGSLRKAGERIRATVQLVSVTSGNALWASKFDEPFTDIFTVEDAIAERVAGALALQLSSEEHQLLTKRYTANVEAHEFYLKGRYYANKFTLEHFHKAIEAFNRALDCDPDFALAYAGIAEAYWIAGDLYLNPLEAVTETKKAALKAVEADAYLAEGHTYLAAAKYTLDWDWVGLEQGFKRAIELNPGFAPAYQWFGWCLSVMGRHDEAILALKQARQLDPFSVGANWFLSAVYTIAGRYEEAIEQANNLIELEPHFWGGYWALGRAYTDKGDFPAAVAANQKAIAIGAPPWVQASLAEAYALSGKKDEARKLLDDLQILGQTQHVPFFFVALAYLGLGENDTAFAHLERSYEQHDSSFPLIKVYRSLDVVRADPRLNDLILRIGLTP